MQQELEEKIGHVVHIDKRLRKSNWKKQTIPVVLLKRIQGNREELQKGPLFQGGGAGKRGRKSKRDSRRSFIFNSDAC